MFKVLAKRLYGKLFADKGYISQKLFDFLFEDGIQLVTGLRVNMKNKLMPFYDRMMLRKRYIIETINDMLKNTAQIVHSRHRSVSNFIMNLISALGAYCFFDNKPKAFKDTASKTRSNFHCSKDRIISFDSLYIGGCVKTLLFLRNHKALTFTSQGFAMSKSCCNFRP